MNEKTSIHDGANQIKTIHVLGMYRDNSAYLDFLFKRFEKWEELYDVAFNYYFMENNSKDDTREKLKTFIASRANSKLILYNLKKDYENVNDGRNFTRIHTLAKLRNKLVDCVTPLPENEWCIMIDSNLYFKDDIIENVFHEKNRGAVGGDVGMMCVYTQQLLIPDIHITNVKDPVLVNHFYDTYSFIDKHGKSFYPMCPFAKCPVCSKYQPTAHPRVPHEDGVVEVNSCFGGFVCIQTDVLNTPSVRWDTILYDIENDKALCEHYLFCDRLRAVLKKKIVVLQNVDNIYRTV
jgi:hypothetical protein